MDPDKLIEAIVIIVEEVAPRRYAPITAALEPVTRAEWLEIRDRVQTLIALNLPRETSE